MNGPSWMALQTPDSGFDSVRTLFVERGAGQSRRHRSGEKRCVVHVSLGLDVGGMERLLVEFARWTDRSRFDLHFVALQSEGVAAKQIRELGWTVSTLGKPAGFRPDLVVSLSRHLRRLGADVVHTHNTAGYLYGVAAAVLARVGNIIHTRHGQRFKAPLRQTMSFRWLSPWVNHMVSVCEDGRRLTIAEGIAADRTCTIRNGIDLSEFPYVGPTHGGPAVVVARLSPEKDIASLIRAVAVAHGKRRVHEPNLILRIVGDGIERASLEQLAEQLGLASSIEFLGQKQNIHETLQGCSMFLLPSLTEGISLTLLEAMACGLPVVATHVGGTPEVVNPGVTGTLVAAKDPEAMANAMLHLWRDPITSQRYGLEGRQRVELEFGIQRMMHQYEQLYATGVRVR